MPAPIRLSPRSVLVFAALSCLGGSFGPARRCWADEPAAAAGSPDPTTPTTPPPAPAPPLPAPLPPPAPPPAPPSSAADALAPPTADPAPVAPLPPVPPAPAPPPGPDTVVMVRTPLASAAPPSPPPSPRRGTPIAPTLTGAAGLLRTSTAEVGQLHQLRAALRGEYFGADGFLIEGDSNRRLAGGLTLGFTLRPDLELFAALLNSSNRNGRLRDVDDRDPELIKTFGDLILGGKWILPLGPAATLGAEVGLKFLSGVSNLAVSPSSTSWWLGPLFTFDLRRVSRVPLRLHAQGSYYADNSKNLYDLSGLTRDTKEVAMFAYGISPSRLHLALAIDAPLDSVFPELPLDPFFEYHAAYVTADADMDFRDYMAPNCGGSDTGRMPCLDNRDLQWVTLGARADVYRGIAVDLALDLRIRSPGFPYGPPVAPWNVVFGVSYALDIDALTRPVIVTREVPIPSPHAGDGQVTGTVRSSQGGVPIAGAVVAVVGRPRARAATDPDGGFATAELAAGPAELEITAPNFETTHLNATVVAGAAVEVSIQMTPSPPTARVHGQVMGPGGKGIEASVRFAGEEIREARTDASGVYSVSLPTGSYQVRAEGPGTEGLAGKDAQVDVLVGQDKQLDFALRAPTANPNVVLSGEGIKLKQPVRFVGLTTKLQPASETLLAAVADVLDVHDDIKRVRIEAHWDSSLPKPRSATLTQQQADAVKAFLVARGIASTRLTAVGVGATRPLVPNLTPVNRARNRRVELHLE